MADASGAADLATLLSRSQAGDAGAWSALVTMLQRDVGVFIASFATSQAMLDELQRAAWTVCRDELASCPGAAAAATWVRQAAMRLLGGALEREAARAAAASDLLSRTLAQAALDGLAALEAPSNAAARQLSARFGALDAGTQALLTRRYGDRAAVAAIAAEQRLEPASAALALYGARAAADWTGTATPTTDALFAALIEEYLAGTISADSRGVIASCLAKDPRRVAQFERQVRLELMLAALLGPGEPALARAVALTPKRRNESSLLQAVAPSPRASGRLPAPSTRRHTRNRRPSDAPSADAGPAPRATATGRRALLIAAVALLAGAAGLTLVWKGGAAAVQQAQPTAATLAHPTGHPAGVAVVRRAGGRSSILAAGKPVPAAIGDQVANGHGLETGGADAELAVAIDGHASLVLGGDTRISALALRAPERMAQAMLGQGTLTAEIAGGDAAAQVATLAIYTAQARVELGDATCDIAARTTVTVITVTRGSVRLARADGTHALTVAAGQRARVVDQGDPALETASVFARGINLGGDEVVIGGQRWLSQRQASTAGLVIAPGAVPAPRSSVSAPGLDFDTKAMLDTGLVAAGGTVSLSQRVPAGDYALWLWIAGAEGLSGQGLALRIGGAATPLGQPATRAAGWWRLGPYRVTADRGVIELAVDGLGETRLAGLQIDRADGIPVVLPLGIALVHPAEGGRGYASEALVLQAEVIGAASAVDKVEYLDGEESLGATSTPPFTLSVRHPEVGKRSYRARVTDRSGAVSTSAPLAFTVMPAGGSGSILREYWRKIGGDELARLTGDPRYPDHPDGTEPLSRFEGPRNWGDDYGTRIRGWVVAPLDGTYVFWIEADDQGELWLSGDDQPAGRRRIASCPEATNPLEWGKHAAQQSQPVSLQAGKRYYIEALHKEGKGNDHIAVGWQLPGGRQERPIPGAHLIPWRTDGAAGAAQPPPAVDRAAAPAATGATPRLGEAVTVVADGKRWQITAPAYRATLAENGYLSSLVVGGNEWLVSWAGPSGSWLYRNGRMALPSIEHPAPTVLTASSAAASLRYDFRPDGIGFSLVNLIDEAMPFYLLLDPRVSAGDAGLGLRKAPFEATVVDSLWIYGPARLAMSGTKRVWRWERGSEALEVILPAKGTAQAAVTLGLASADEQKAAAAAH